jgi:LPXTG-motif cell wall-anchored protein
VAIVRTPHLTTSISANRGSADVRYFPPTLEISGKGFATRRLEAAGDTVELGLPKRRSRTASTPSVPGAPLRALLSTVRPDAVRGLVPAGADAVPLLPGLPPRPGVPPVPADTPESAHRRPDSNRSGVDLLRITIGDVRQAAAGHAVAARAVSVHVQVIAAPSAAGRGGLVLDLDIGVLEAAAVAPDPGTAGGAGVPPDAAGGGTGALPVTGSSMDLTLLAGGVLLVAGSVFLWFGLRKRPRV